MSPHHRRIVPLMAQKFGFDYAFVTYKWPHWLHKQTDKQRIIWWARACEGRARQGRPQARRPRGPCLKLATRKPTAAGRVGKQAAF